MQDWSPEPDHIQDCLLEQSMSQPTSTLRDSFQSLVLDPKRDEYELLITLSVLANRLEDFQDRHILDDQLPQLLPLLQHLGRERKLLAETRAELCNVLGELSLHLDDNEDRQFSALCLDQALALRDIALSEREEFNQPLVLYALQGYASFYSATLDSLDTFVGPEQPSTVLHGAFGAACDIISADPSATDSPCNSASFILAARALGASCMRELFGFEKRTEREKSQVLDPIIAKWIEKSFEEADQCARNAQLYHSIACAILLGDEGMLTYLDILRDNSLEEARFHVAEILDDAVRLEREDTPAHFDLWQRALRHSLM